MLRRLLYESSLQTFKEREDETSQLNRLGENAANRVSVTLAKFSSAHSRQYFALKLVQFLTKFEDAAAFEQVRTES